MLFTFLLYSYKQQEAEFAQEKPKYLQMQSKYQAEQTEGQHFLSTFSTSAGFVALFWSNGLNNFASSVCPYASRKQVEKDSLLFWYSSK